MMDYAKNIIILKYVTLIIRQLPDVSKGGRKLMEVEK